ncbi:transient receptor potential cation channel subfamily A member 1-like, partial [Ciconia maguari]
MQRLIGLLRRVRERPPSGSASAPCAVGAPELQEKGRGGLHSAAASGDLAQLQRRWWWKRLRINKRDAKKQTPLHLACANGHTDVIRFLAGEKCQLNPRDNFKKTPLMKLGYTPLAVAITEHCEEMVEFLLQKGADVHARDQHLRTTLMVAVHAGDKNVIRLLLQHGADLSHEDIFGSTAMYYASLCANADIPNQLEEYMRCERMGERSAGGPQGPAVLGSSCSGTTADFPLGTPALTRAGVLPAAGAEQEEDDDSPFDSE